MTSLSRRNFLKFTGAALGGGLVAATTFLYLGDESRQLSLERITIPVVNLPPAFEGFKIAQMSDFHLYPYTTPELIRQAVEITNGLKPDLTVLTGDFVWRNLGAVFDLAQILSGLNARYGVYSVLGNHDLWSNASVVKGALRESGLPVLENQGIPVNIGKSTLYLAGLDDGWSGNPDLDAALENAPPGAPVVLLLHEPDLVDIYSKDSRLALQLSGHSHGGQVRLRSIGPLILPHLGRKYDFGLYRVNNMWLYTNRGIGNISVPLRYNCPPEITLFTLGMA